MSGSTFETRSFERPAESGAGYGTRLIERSVHRYGDDPSQLGELFLPEGAGRHPVAVVLHGGFWRDAYDRSLMDAVCEHLAGSGWAVWNLEYRRLGSGGGWPETFLDVDHGVDHLSSFAGPELDLSRVVSIGHSAGGHLALWAASRREPRVPVTAAVSQAGVADLAEAHRLRLSGGVVQELLGSTPVDQPERYAHASPYELLPLGVPQLLVHGGRDEIVPVDLSRDYARAAAEAGDPVDLVVHEELGHFEHLDPGSPAWASVRDWLTLRHG